MCTLHRIVCVSECTLSSGGPARIKLASARVGLDELTYSKRVAVGGIGGTCHTKKRTEDGGDAAANGVGRKRLSVIVVDEQDGVRTSWAAINVPSENGFRAMLGVE